VTNTNHAVSLVSSASLSFSSPPTNIQWPVQIMQFLWSHLPHFLSVHHPPTFNDQYKSCSFSGPICPTFFLVHHPPTFSDQYKSCSFSCPICPTVFQFTTDQLSVTSTNHAVSLFPSAPLSFSSPPTNIQSPIQMMQFLLSHLSHCLSVHHPPLFSHQYKSCSSSLYNFVHHPATLSFCTPNISLGSCSSTIFSC
jgi:hypothetical protein